MTNTRRRRRGGGCDHDDDGDDGDGDDDDDDDDEDDDANADANAGANADAGGGGDGDDVAGDGDDGDGNDDGNDGDGDNGDGDGDGDAAVGAGGGGGGGESLSVLKLPHGRCLGLMTSSWCYGHKLHSPRSQLHEACISDEWSTGSSMPMPKKRSKNAISTIAQSSSISPFTDGFLGHLFFWVMGPNPNRPHSLIPLSGGMRRAAKKAECAVRENWFFPMAVTAVTKKVLWSQTYQIDQIAAAWG